MCPTPDMSDKTPDNVHIPIPTVADKLDKMSLNFRDIAL